MDAAIDRLGEVLAHGVVAAIVVQVLVRRVPVTAPATRVEYRVASLALPLVVTPALWLIAPFRRDETFGDVALFATSHWERLVVFGVPVLSIALVALTVTGIGLFAPDVVRFTRGWWRDRAARHLSVPEDDPMAVAVDREVVACAAVLGIPAPRLVLVDVPAPRLHCRGVWRPAIVVTRSAVNRLPERELRAALAHELAHIERADVLRGWVLLVLRAVQWFNPVAQIVGRRAVQEMEFEADRRAALATRQPLAVARALLRSARDRDTDYLGVAGRSRISVIEDRCRRLLMLERDPLAYGPSRSPEVAIASAAIAGLLFFVV